MLKNRGPAFALAGLFAVAVYGVSFSSQKPPDHQTVTRPDQNTSQRITPESADEKIAFYTEVLAVFTGILALVSTVQIAFLIKADETAKVTAQAAKDAADIARNTLIASQRAWVKVKVTPAAPLVFDHAGACVSISFEITNIGNSPATNITSHAWITCKDAWRKQKLESDEVRSQPLGIGFTLFPTETFPRSIGVSHWITGARIDKEEFAEAVLKDDSRREYVQLYVVGFVDYTFSTDPATHHQTGFNFAVMKNPFGRIMLEDGQVEILFMDDCFGIGRYAD